VKSPELALNPTVVRPTGSNPQRVVVPTKSAELRVPALKTMLSRSMMDGIFRSSAVWRPN